MRLLAKLILLHSLTHLFFFWYLSSPLKYLFLQGFMISLYLGLHIHFDGSPKILGKSNGKVQIYSYFLWWPLHILVFIFSKCLDRIKRLFRSKKETEVTQISEKFYLGGKYSPYDMTEEEKNNITVVVDLTNEFDQIYFKNLKIYKNIQTWDGCCPNLKDMEQAADEIIAWYNDNKNNNQSILVHCGYGRGRSTTFLCFLMVKLGIHKDHKEAYQKIKEKRPYVRLNHEMRKVLEIH